MSRQRAPHVNYASTLEQTDNLNSEAYLSLMTELIPQLHRVLKRGGHFYMFFVHENYDALCKLLTRSGLMVDHTPLIWMKNNTSAPFCGFHYQSQYEPILFGWKPPARRLQGASSNILQFATVTSKKRLHAFEKPADLLEFLIRQSTNPSELVLDPFAGSGSVLLAAKNCGRSSLGFEVNPDHVAKSQIKLTTGLDAIARAQEKATAESLIDNRPPSLYVALHTKTDYIVVRTETGEVVWTRPIGPGVSEAAELVAETMNLKEIHE